LTKSPERYELLNLPEQHWYGFSVTNDRGYRERRINTDDAGPAKVFVSLEPFSGFVCLNNGVDWLDWVIVGAQTNPVKLPSKHWILDLRRQCEEMAIPLFEKNSLKQLDLPGGLRQEWPEGFERKKGGKRNEKYQNNISRTMG